MTAIELSGPGPLGTTETLHELGQALVRAAVSFTIAESDLHNADQVCGEIRSRVPPGVMPPPHVQRELAAALQVSKKCFQLVKQRDAEWKDIARKITRELSGVAAQPPRPL